jgi:hypothetical protein
VLETLPLYSVSPLCSKIIEEKKMIEQEFAQNPNGEFAEKCRKGLEKAYGIDIPMPKCMAKKSSAPKKRSKLF